MTFLLPDRSADDDDFRTGDAAIQMGERMVEIVDAWFEEDDPTVSVRFIDRALGHFVVGVPHGRVARQRKAVQVLVARSDGTVTVDDSYIPALEWYSTSPIYDVAQATLRTVLHDPIFLRIEELQQSPAPECQTCPWLSLCGGGDLENRYSTRNGFDNPSIYCESLKILYRSVCDRLIARGYPADEVKERFGEHALTS
jgi:uncharacterized protein